MPMWSYDLRTCRKGQYDYGNALEVKVRKRSLWERLEGAWILLFVGWGW